MHSWNILTHYEIIRNNSNISDWEITKEKSDSTRAHGRHLAANEKPENKRKFYCTNVHLKIIEILITLMYKSSAVTVLPLHLLTARFGSSVKQTFGDLDPVDERYTQI